MFQSSKNYVYETLHDIEMDPLFPGVENSGMASSLGNFNLSMADSDPSLVVVQPSLKQSKKKFSKSKDFVQEKSIMDLELRPVEIADTEAGLASPLSFSENSTTPPAVFPSPVLCQEQILTSMEEIGQNQFFVVDCLPSSPNSILIDGVNHSFYNQPLSHQPVAFSQQPQQQPYILVPQMPVGIPMQPPVSVFSGPVASPVSSPVDFCDPFLPQYSTTPISMTPVSSPVPSPPQSPVSVPKAPLSISLKGMKIIQGPPPVEKNPVVENNYPPVQALPPPVQVLPAPRPLPPPAEVRFAPPVNFNNIDYFYPVPAPVAPVIPEIPTGGRKRSASEISHDQKSKKKGNTKNSSILSNKRGKKHSNITIEEELHKALNEGPSSGVTPILHPGTNYPRYVVINEDKFYNYILSSRPEEYKLDKASLLEKFDKSRPCNRVNPKDRYGKVPIKYLRIDNRKKNPESVKKEMTNIKSVYSKQKIRIITHRDWDVLPVEDFIYEIKQKK